MNQNTIFSFSSSFFFYLLSTVTLCSSLNPKFQACEPTACGNVPNITYPFYIKGRQEPYCGYPGFALSCSNSAFPILNLSETQYIVHEIFYNNQSIRVSDAALSISNTTACLPRAYNLTVDGSRFGVAPNQKDLFLVFGCNLESLPEGFTEYRIGCSAENGTDSVLGMTEEGEDLSFASKNCEGGVVKTKVEDDKGRINGEVLRRGFVLNWTAADCSLCAMTGGKCGFDSATYSFSCYCQDRDHARKCDPDGKSWGLKLGLGLGLGFGMGLPAILIIGWLIGRHYRRKNSSSNDQLESRNMYSDNYSNPDPDPENGTIYFGVPLFSYKELQDATNNFDHTRALGDGGFGVVYYGKLRDGREVAVKHLYEHNFRRVEQFRNEVKILANLRHKNLVSLYGCSSRQSRDLLLVYEYISNGTVACHLHGDSSKHAPLSWPTRIKIALETASALAYLHASDIIHRDVKTTNILLDSNFTVKVADFGLSRLFPNDASHVSTAPQGTPGYVDPEYYQCYQLTSKSDVYSFGVVLFELISSKPAVDMSRSKEEVNLSSLAVKKIQESAIGDLVDPWLGMEKDSEVSRMVMSVGELAFQCLQRDKELRPSMDEVLEALKRIESGKGHVEDLALNTDNVSTVPPPPPPPMSPDWEDVGLLKKVKLSPSSPNTVTDKWKSESTTPFASR